MRETIPVRTLVVCGLFITAVVLLPQKLINSVFICAIREVMGIDCPGCGLMRAMAYLLHGQWHQAVALYPLAPLILIGFVAFFVDGMRLAVIGGRPIVHPLMASQGVTVVIGLIFIQWIVKLGGLW